MDTGNHCRALCKYKLSVASKTIATNNEQYGRTTRLDERDLTVTDHVECEENDNNVEDQVAKKRSLHEVKRAAKTHRTNNNCCQKYSRS